MKFLIYLMVIVLGVMLFVRFILPVIVFGLHLLFLAATVLVIIFLVRWVCRRGGTPPPEA